MARFKGTYDTSKVYWVDELPEINVETTAEKVAVKVKVWEADIFTDNLYPFDGEMHLQIANLVRERLEVSGEPVAFPEMRFEDGDDRPAVGHHSPLSLFLRAILRRRDIGMSAEDFTQTHFLTTAKSKWLPAGAADTLSVYMAPNTKLNALYTVIYEINGVTVRTTVAYNGANQAYARVETLNVAWPTLPAGAVPLVMSVTSGMRTMNYYNPRRECSALRMLNAFNCGENLYYPTSMKSEISVKKSESMINGRRTTYDRRTEQTIELNFGPQQPDDAALIGQLADSPDIIYLDCFRSGDALSAENARCRRLLVTDASFRSDPEDESAEIPVLKCSPASGRPILLAGLDEVTGRVFTGQFASQFS